VECKNGYPKTSLFQHFANIKNFNIEKFWLQCINDAKKSERHPMLIYKKKGRQPIIGISEEVYYKIMNSLTDLPYLSMKFSKHKLPTVMFYDFKDFFNTITPDILKERLYGKS